MSESSEIQFAPFAALNQFMLPEYRQTVIETVLKGLEALPRNRRSTINGLIRQHVKIPGFRHSDLAPLPIRVKRSGVAFEKHSDFVAHTLACWADLHAELRQQVFDLLAARNWEALPVEVERTKLPGFLVRWPKAENYDLLDSAFKETYPDAVVDVNDLRLMVVWVSGRLPFDMVDSDKDA